jgi:sugar phosphate isomerase/epimerase
VNAGAGDIDWISFFATLSVVEYEGFVCAERTNSANPSSDVAASVGFLRRFVPMG